VTEIRQAQHAAGIIAPKPKGPVLNTPSKTAVATSTVKRGFVSSKFLTLRTFAHRLMVTGEMGLGYPYSKDQGRPLSVRTPARLFTCVQHLVHPLPLNRQTVGSLIQTGIQTMTHVPQGQTTPTTQATSATHPHQLFADAVNAASMATWYTRRGNIAAAARKARQHLAALRLLAKLEGGAA
jgi:hypothetical protein